MAKSKEWLIDSINRGIEENKKQGTYNYVSKNPAYKSGRNPLSQSQATKVSYDENGKMKISLVPGGAAAVRDLARQQLGMKSSTINGEETRYDYQGAVNKLGYNNVVNAVDSLVNREHMKDTAIEREIWQQMNGATGMGTPRFDDPDDYTPVISYLDTQINSYKKTGASSNPLITAIQQASERAYGNGGAKSIKYRSDILKTLEQQRTALGQKQDNLYAQKVLNEIKNNKDEDLFARLQNIDTVINSTNLYKWSDQYKTMGSGVEARKAERENIIKVLKEKGYSDPELYLKYYSKIMNNKAAKDLNEDIDKFVKDHSVVGPAAATAFAVATAGASGITKLAGKAFGDTGFNALNLVGAAGSAMTESVTRNIQANNPGTKGKVFSFLYNAGVSALESASIMGTLGGGIGEAIMGLNAAMDTYDEARAKGVDGVNAFASAFAAGVFEAVFEHVGWDKISFLASSGKGGLAAGIKDVLVSMGTEGAEEVLTDLANEMADYLINGGLSDYELAKASGMSDGEYAKQLGMQLLESFAAGALSGGMMYGSARAGNAIGNKVTGAVSNLVAGSDVQRTGSTQDLIREATIYPQEEIQLDSLHLRQQQAKTAEAKNKVSQKISELRETYKAGKLYNAIDAQNVRSAVSSRIDTVNSGLEAQTKKNISDGIASVMKGKTLTEAQAAAINTETGSQILDEVINNDPWVQEMNVGRLKTQVTAGLAEARTERAMNMPVGTLNARRQYDDALKEKTGEITKAIKADDGVSLVNNMGELGGIKAVTENGIEVVIDKDSGATSAYSDVKSSDADVDMIYDTAGMEVHGTVPADTLKAFGATVQLNSGAKMSIAAANVQIGMYDKTVNSDTGAYLALTYEAYKAGLSGMTFENYMNNHTAAELEDTVTEGQLRQMYRMGASDHIVKPGVTRIGTKALSQTELDTLTVLDEFFKGKGRPVFVVDELTEDNAYYVAGKDTIVLALNAEGGLLTTAAFHELLHQTVNDLGKTEGDKLVDAIIDVLRESVGEEKLDEIYSEKKRQYEDIIADMPYAAQFEYIKEEIAAQYFGSIASVNEDYLANHMQKDMSFWQKIMDKFRKILDDIREKAKAFADRDLIVASALKTEDDKAQKVLEAFEKAFDMADMQMPEEPGIPSESKESRRNDAKMMDKALAANKLIPDDVMKKAAEDRATTKELLAAAESKGIRLPEDIEGKAFVSNSSYGGTTMENTTVCPRSIGVDALCDAIAINLGRPIGVEENIAIAQNIGLLTRDIQCLYCYVAADRMAYREALGNYIIQRDRLLEAIRTGEIDPEKMVEVTVKKKDGTKNTIRVSEAVVYYADGRTITTGKNGNVARVNAWLKTLKNGGNFLTAADLADVSNSDQTLAARRKAIKDADVLAEFNNAVRYAQSASRAKKRIEYQAYRGDILSWKKDKIEHLNHTYGLRFYSFSDFSPAFILENMQEITDASVRGLKGLAYTKATDFARIFAPTGININISVFGQFKDGVMHEDDMQGASWAETKELRDKFENVGAVFVATDDESVKWALGQDWIDVVIPYHLVFTGEKIAEHFNWTNFTEMSSDIKTKAWTKGNDAGTIYPYQHNNDKATYLDLLQKNHLRPRFEQYLDNPNYMKLINETRRTNDQTPAMQPIFDMDAVRASIAEMEKTGSYLEPIGGSTEAMMAFAGTMADAIRDYDGDNVAGLQLDSEAFAEAYEKAVGMKPGIGEAGADKHSLRVVSPVQPSSDLWDRGHTESWFIDNGYPLYKDTLTEAEKEEMANENKGHGTQISGTISTYKKLFETIKTMYPSTWKDMRILDASSGLGLGTEVGRSAGFDVTDIEPFPGKNYSPDFTDYEKLESLIQTGDVKPFDFIICNAVLNVIPQDTRDNLVAAMGNLLADGGEIFVNVIDRNYVGALSSTESTVYKNGRPTGSVRTMAGDYSVPGKNSGKGHETFVYGSNSVQKVFSYSELKAYLEDALGEGYTVTPYKKLGMVAAWVKKDNGENERDIRYSKKNKIEKPNKNAYNETETNFMIWSKSKSSEVGSCRVFKRFGKFRYYQKSEDGVIEVTRKEYDEERQKRWGSYYGEARDNVYRTSDQVRLESGGYRRDHGVSGHAGEDIEIARRDGGEQLQNELSGNIKRDRGNTEDLPDGGVKPSRRIRTTAEIISELGEKNEVLDEALKTTKRELKKVREAYEKAALDMTETGGTIPKRGVITDIVAKHNDENLTGISNREFRDRLFRLFTEFAQGEGSSDALVNAVLDVMYDKAANSEETLENENRIAIREYVAGKKFFVDEITWRQLTENSGSRGALNAAYKNTFGFTLAPNSEMKDGKGSSWSDTAAEIADQIGYVFSGSTYEDNAREGASYEVAAALYEKAASGAMSNLVHTVFGTTEDAYNAAKIETMDMVTELLRASTLRTKADRYVDQMEKLKDRYQKKAEKREAEIREIIDKLKAEKAELKTNMAGELKEQKQKTADLRTEKNLRYEAMRRYYIDRNREAVQQRNETKRRAAARKNITKTVKWLNNRFVNETDTKNIPERMKSIVAPFLQVFLDEETTPGGNTTIFRYEQLNRLAEFYDRFDDNVDPEEIPQDLVPLIGLFDEDVAVTLRNLRDTVAGRRLSDLTLAELEDVKKVMTNLKHIVQNAGAAFVNGRKVMIADAGDEMIRHAQDHKLSLSQKAEQIPLIGKKIKGANAYLNTSMLKPVYFFKEKLGGTIGQFYDGIREGQNTWYFRVADARDFFEETKERFGYKDWKKDAHHFTTERGDRLSLDVEAIMQLYATYNRERLNTTDTNHILEGGIVLGEKLAENQKALDKKADAKRSAEEYADNSRIRLSVTDIENIISVLSEEQIGYADAVVDYLSTTCAEWGNEASMQLFGIRKYTEQYYFPFQSADNFLFTRFGQQQEARLKHVGFTNRLQHGANNPLIISSLTEVAAGHASQMASYSSLAVPIENMQRLYNYKNNDTTVKSEIENAYGSSAKAYLNTFMSDINGGVRNDRIGGIFNNMVGKFKRAAVMLNMSVVVQQPSAVTRAMALVDPKYFVRSTFRYADYDELLKYSGVAGVKSIGGFDTGTGTGTISFITGENSISEKLGNVTGFLAEKADAITWSHIWNAVKRETAAKMGIKYQSEMPETFYAEAAKRFNDVVDYTQVYDSVLSRSEVMRSKDNLAKMVSAFMAEPTTTYNMLVASGKDKSIGKAAAITAFIMNVVLNTALKSLVSAWRDDSDKSYWERYVNKFFGDVFGSSEAFHLDSEFSMIGMIPWVKDILSLFAGYDVERSDITALEEIVDVIGQVRDFLGKEDITDEDIKELLFAAVVAVSDLTGLPLKSVARDINGLKAQLERSKNADYHTTLDTIKREIAAAWAGDPKKRESVYQAVLNGDEETIRRIMTPSAEDIQKIKDANGWTEEQAKSQAEADAADKFHAAVREALKENDDRILEAAQARYDGKTGVYADIAQEIIDEGIFDRDDILAAISSEFNKLKNAEADEYEDPEAKDVAMFVKSDFINAMIGGDADTAEAAKNEIIRSAVANGKTEEQAQKSFTDAVTTSAKEMFFADEISQKQALGILQEAGVKKSDAEGKIDWWSWDKEYGQKYPDIDQTTYNAWANKGLESQGISFDTWATYKTECQKLRGGTGNTVTKDQKMKVIDGMKLTYSQKDALYYAEGWAASRIYEAPWH